VKPQHRSLYYFLLGYARRRGNVTRFNMPYENGLHGSGIGSWATYDAALRALHAWGFIVYTPGANRYKAPVIELTFRNPTDDVLLTYWQSYCISTGDIKRPLDLEKVVEDAQATTDRLEEEKAELLEEVAALKAELAEQAGLKAKPAPKPAKALALATTEEEDLQPVENSPLAKFDAFAAIIRGCGYANIDAERYRKQIAAKSVGLTRTAAQWRSRIIEYVNRDHAAGKLLTLAPQTPNEVPSNWNQDTPYAAPQGMGIPSMSSILKPEYQVN
jgi:hypothetical protein